MKAILISADGLTRMMDVPDNRSEILLPLIGFARTHPWKEDMKMTDISAKSRRYLLFASDRPLWMDEDVLVYREMEKEL